MVRIWSTISKSGASGHIASLISEERLSLSPPASQCCLLSSGFYLNTYTGKCKECNYICGTFSIVKTLMSPYLDKEIEPGIPAVSPAAPLAFVFQRRSAFLVSWISFSSLAHLHTCNHRSSLLLRLAARAQCRSRPAGVDSRPFSRLWGGPRQEHAVAILLILGLCPDFDHFR